MVDVKDKKQSKRKKSKQKHQQIVTPSKLNVPKLSEEQQRKYDYYFLEAAKLKLEKKYDAGFEMLQHCLSINPYAASAHYEIGQYYLTQTALTSHFVLRESCTI